MKTEIAKLREETGARQKEVAADCGVSVRYFRSVEKGERESKSLTQRAVALMRAR